MHFGFSVCSPCSFFCVCVHTSDLQPRRVCSRMASASAFSAAIILASNHKCAEDDSPTTEAAAALLTAVPAGIPSPPQSTASSPLTSPELLRLLASVGQKVPSPPSQHTNDARAPQQYSNHEADASQHASLISPALLRLFGMTPPPALADAGGPAPLPSSLPHQAAEPGAASTAVVPSAEAFRAGDGSSASEAAVDRLFSNLRHSLADEMTHTTRSVYVLFDFCLLRCSGRSISASQTVSDRESVYCFFLPHLRVQRRRNETRQGAEAVSESRRGASAHYSGRKRSRRP